jgi:hypothetical protein
MPVCCNSSANSAAKKAGWLNNFRLPKPENPNQKRLELTPVALDIDRIAKWRQVLVTVLLSLSCGEGAGFDLEETEYELREARSTSVTWSKVAWNTLFTAKQHSVAGNILLGHPLDITFDSAGTVWSIGEFAMSLAKVSNTTLSSHRILSPLLNGTYPAPFVNSIQSAHPQSGDPTAIAPFAYSASSELGERIIRAGNYVWATQGGTQFIGTDKTGVYNHSLLIRVNTANPMDVCLVPVPGDNNQVIGVAYDPVRHRVWFTQSAGDHLTSPWAKQSMLSWVKADASGRLCQSTLDFNNRAGAATTINSLKCTAAQESDANADCVHTVKDRSVIPGPDLLEGAGHLTYDETSDCLWIVDYATRFLYRYDIDTDRARRIRMPAPGAGASSPYLGAVAWQVEANANAVFINEYIGNRLLRLDKAKLGISNPWFAIQLPVSTAVQTHSLALRGSKLWFTISDETPTENLAPRSRIGYVDVNQWEAGNVTGRMLIQWDTLPHPYGVHSFRGIAANGARLAVTDDGNRSIVVLTAK